MSQPAAPGEAPEILEVAFHAPECQRPDHRGRRKAPFAHWHCVDQWCSRGHRSKDEALSCGDKSVTEEFVREQAERVWVFCKRHNTPGYIDLGVDSREGGGMREIWALHVNYIGVDAARLKVYTGGYMWAGMVAGRDYYPLPRGLHESWPLGLKATLRHGFDRLMRKLRGE